LNFSAQRDSDDSPLPPTPFSISTPPDELADNSFFVYFLLLVLSFLFPWRDLHLEPGDDYDDHDVSELDSLDDNDDQMHDDTWRKENLPSVPLDRKSPTHHDVIEEQIIPEALPQLVEDEPNLGRPLKARGFHRGLSTRRWGDQWEYRRSLQLWTFFQLDLLLSKLVL
jgi:hypothetical protein